VPESAPRTATLVCVALSLLAGITALRPVASGDTYWHLTLGKSTADAGWFCFPEPVGLSAVETYCNHYWAWNLPAWLTWELGGAPALGVLTALTAVVASWLILLLARTLTGPGAPWTGIALGALAVAGVHHRFVARPQSVFLLLVPAALLLALRWRRHPSPLPRGLLAGTAALLLVWAHAHASVTIAPLIVASLAFGVALVPTGLVLDGVSKPRVAAFLGLCTLLLLGPEGVAILDMVAEHADSDISEHVGEFQSMPRDAWWPPWDTSLALAELLLLLGAVGALRKRRLELGPLALALLGLLMTWNAVRFRAVWSVLTLPFAAVGWAPDTPGGSEVRDARVFAALAVLLSGASLVADNPRPRLGVDEAIFPVGPADVLRGAALTGPVFAGHRAGGYLGWELGGAVQIPIDGRAPLLFNEEEYFAARRAMADYSAFEALDRRHRFEAAVTYKDTNTCQGLMADPSWVPVWTGETFALFGAADGALRGKVRPLSAIDPCGSTLARCRLQPEVGPRARAEAVALQSLTPNDAWLPRLDALLGLQCPPTGADSLVGDALARAEELDPRHPDLPWLRAQARLKTGDAEGSLVELALARGHVESDLLTLRILRSLDRPEPAAPIARALLKQQDDAATAEMRDLGGWAFGAVGDWRAASRQAIRGAIEGSEESRLRLRDLLTGGHVPDKLVPVAEGLLAPPRRPAPISSPSQPSAPNPASATPSGSPGVR